MEDLPLCLMHARKKTNHFLLFVSLVTYHKFPHLFPFYFFGYFRMVPVTAQKRNVRTGGWRDAGNYSSDVSPTLMSSRQLWLLAWDLHKIEPTKIMT